jgi:ketosteroid isomerase-like protein/thioredoxin-like negative regulator of GroEL
MPLLQSVNRFSLRSISLCVALSLGTSVVLADELGEVQALLAKGKAAEALKKVEQLQAAKPNDPDLQLQRGIALTQLNRNTEAIASFQKLIETHPELPGAYNNLAVLYGNQGNYEKAREALELALRTNPGYSTAFRNLGDVYARMAGQAHKKALALDTSGPPQALKLAAVQRAADGNVDPRSNKPITAAPVATPAPAPIVPSAVPSPAPVAAPTPAPATAIKPVTPAPVEAKPAVMPPPAHIKPVTPAPTATAPAAAPTPAPASKPPAAEPSSRDTLAVEKAMQRWAQAWSQRDMSSYYAAYAPEFKGKSASRKAWEEERRLRITSKKKISVQLSDISIKVNGNKATLRVRQNYTSDALSVKSTKNFEMVKNKLGDWQITQESSS